jgi:predicted DNA-binding transcriptional regulator AlpA
MQGLQDTETMDGDEREWMTADDVARMLGMTPAWVYSQTRADRIPHVPLGRYVRYRRSVLEVWFAEIERGSLTPAPDSGHRGASCETLGRRV